MKKSLLAIAVALLTLGACTTQGDENKQEAATADNGQAAIENIMTRTSIRQYKDQPVEDEKIDIMLKAAMAAPTAVNLQPWHFIVITDKETIGVLSGRQPTNAPLLIAGCGDTDKTTMPDGNGKLPDFWIQDVSAATENLLLAVEAYGLGACWTACYPYGDRMAPVKKALGLPATVVPYCVVPIGYPGGGEQPKDKWDSSRIHYNQW